jgi:glycosyltransferase involved in cell wall biosynthesis
MAKICVVTDFDETGSGYKNICIPLLTGLANEGHEIKVAGFQYKGSEHRYPFSLIPAENLRDQLIITRNLVASWTPDVILVAMDIPIQQYFHENLQDLLKGDKDHKPIKYIAITPLENGPLTMSWAAVLLNMDAVFFISELGKQEALKAGISQAEHLLVGVDTVLWHPATPAERSQLRKGLGIGEDEFVVLTVADNQERKNLWAGMEAMKLLKDSNVGWKLNDLAFELGIMKEFMTFNRGLPQNDLWGLYAISDAYLQPSKAEGLGMPVLEAMACGVPCVATDTGALTELLEEDRGFLIRPAYTFRDVWGNSKRDMINTEQTAYVLWEISLMESSDIPSKALDFVRSKTWDIPVKQLDSKIKELTNE